MLNNLPCFIGLRYVRAKRRNSFISFISFISTVGISLGVIVMITVLSVMNGFEHELKTRILGMASHATVFADNTHLADWESIGEEMLEHSEVLGVAPFLRKEGMVTNNNQVHGAIIRGVLPDMERTVSVVANHIVAGSLDELTAGSYNVTIGIELARKLNATVGGKITVVAPLINATPAGVVPRYKRFTVAAIFEAGLHEFDSGLVLMHLNDAQKLFRLQGPMGLRLKTDDILHAPRISHEIMSEVVNKNNIRERFYIVDWTQRHANFFEALKTEKTVMFIILIFIIAVAAFNIISTLVMMVNDKRSDIAVLRTLGATPRTITNIFMVQGTFIGILGILIGNVLGIALALNVPKLVSAIEKLFRVDFLDASIYYISDIPSQFEWSDVIVINIVTFLICFLMTIYPAKRAANIPPAEALRYE